MTDLLVRNARLVATVDARGLVTATGAGWVDIIARVSESEISGTVTLLVEVVPAREALKAFYNATGPVIAMDCRSFLSCASWKTV